MKNISTAPTGALSVNPTRALAIDAFRGLTIFTMVFVNELSGTADIPYWMKHFHADQDGMSFVDLVFPAFLFIVGMSIAFAIQARIQKGDSTLNILKHIALRSLGLIVIGVFMVNAESGYNSNAMNISMPVWSLLLYISVLLIWPNYSKKIPALVSNGLKLTGVTLLIMLWWLYKGENGANMTPQWWGILGLIGWAYLIASCIYIFSKKSNQQIYILTAAVAGLLFAFVALNNIKASSDSWLSVIVDNSMNCTHAMIVLSGLILSQLFFHPAFATHKIRNYTIFTLTVLVSAFISWHFFPISKINATPSWALFSIFFCSLIFGLIYWLVDSRKQQSWCKLFEPAATNPLFVYLIPDIIVSLVGILGISIRPGFFHAGFAGIIWSLFFASLILFVGSLINRTGFRLKL